METLTLQQIAPYLPYGLQVQSKDLTMLNNIYDATGYDRKGLFLDNIKDSFEINGVLKPILYPISCLTKEITVNGETFVPVVKLCSMLWDEYYGADYDEYNLSDMEINIISLCSSIRILTYDIALKLAEWHINFVGISEGLYIDKSTLKK